MEEKCLDRLGCDRSLADDSDLPIFAPSRHGWF